MNVNSEPHSEPDKGKMMSEPEKGKHHNPAQDVDADEEPDTDRECYLIDGPFDQQEIAFQLAQAVWEINTGSFSAMVSIDDSKVLLRLHVLHTTQQHHSPAPYAQTLPNVTYSRYLKLQLMTMDTLTFTDVLWA